MGETIGYNLEFTSAQRVRISTNELIALSQQFQQARRQIEELKKIKLRLTEQLHFIHSKSDSYKDEIQYLKNLRDSSQQMSNNYRNTEEAHLSSLTAAQVEGESSIKELMVKNVALKEDNSQLKLYITELESLHNTLVKCKNCKISYSLNMNTESTCISHPGRLKFYSCRGCGGDEYWTCCMKCTKCNKGCRVSKHVAR
jgi:chromosome segregation ATPase